MPDTKREQVLSVRDLDITFKTTAGPVHAIRGVNIDPQLTDWNFELRGAQAWIADENRWDYSSVKVHLPNGDYHFAL